MSLYEKVLKETRPFLGDQTDQFVRRQCEGHLRVEPTKLTKAHLQRLSFWIMMSSSLIISRDQAEILEKRIIALEKDS